MIEKIVIISLVSTFVLVCMKKWGWLDRYEAYYGHVKWMRYILGPSNCFFCLGFRIAAIATSFLMLKQYNADYLVIPPCAAPLIAFLATKLSYNDRN